MTHADPSVSDILPLPSGRDVSDQPGGVAWATWVMIAACVAMFDWIWPAPLLEPNFDLNPYGVRSPGAIWDGAYWALLPPMFVHLSVWHLAMNLLPTWLLGSVMERAIGGGKFLLFCLATGPITVAWQLAASGAIGCGFSGVLFAIYGFLWGSADRYPGFRPFVDRTCVSLVLLGIAAGFLPQWLDMPPVANAGHIGGLLWGVAVGRLCSGKRSLVLGWSLAAVVLAVAIVPLFWAPWLTTWLEYKAEHALRAERFEVISRNALASGLNRTLARSG